MLFGSSNPYLTDLNKAELLSLATDIDVREFSELHQCACLKSVENIHEKYIKPAGCYYQKLKNRDTVPNSWGDELADSDSLDDFDKADAEFIVNQLTLVSSYIIAHIGYPYVSYYMTLRNLTPVPSLNKDS